MRRGEWVETAAVVLVAVCVAGIGALHVRRRPEPGGLLGFDLATGAVRFAERAETASVHLDAIGPGILVVSGADNCSLGDREQLYAYSLPGGALSWQRKLRGACSRYDPVAPVSRGIVAVDAWPWLEGWGARDGTTRWRKLRVQGTPSQTGDAVIIADSNTGAVRFLDPRTGNVRHVGRARYKPYPWLLTSREAIFVTQSSDGVKEQLTALDASTGRRLWRIPSATGETGWNRAADGVIVTGPQGSMVARDARTGARLWLRRAAGDLEFAGAGLALFVHGTTLEARALRTGRLRWRATLSRWRPGWSQIVAASGSVVVIDQDRVAVLAAHDGAARWSRPLATDRLAAHAPAVISAGLLVIPATSSAFTPYDE